MQDRIRILQVVRPANGGMKEHVNSLLTNLNPDEFQLALACPGDGEIVSTATAKGIPVFPVDISGELSPWQDCRAAASLAAAIRQWRPQVVHAHGAKAGLTARLASFLSGRHGGAKQSVVVTAHNFVYSGSVTGWKQKLLLSLEKALDPLTDRIITVSDNLRAEIIGLQGTDPGKVVRIYNGLSYPPCPGEPGVNTKMDKPEIRTSLGLDPMRPVVGTVARLAPQKGVQYFIEMAAELSAKRPELQFLIVGDGPLRPALERLAESLKVKEKTCFTGFVANAIPLLTAMDIFVLPSLSEGLGVSILEALGCRIPVIATQVGGIPEIIQSGENGILVPPGNSRALADGTIYLLENNYLAHTMSELGFQQLQDKFSLAGMIKQTEEVYREVVAFA